MHINVLCSASVAAATLALYLTLPTYKKKAPATVQAEKAMRARLTEREIDQALKDSFPCSDPPSWY